MTKSILLSVLLLCFFSGWSQELYMSMGKIASTFEYQDSQGQQLDNLQAVNKNVMSFGIKDELFNNKLQWLIGTGYSGYGAIGSISAYDNFLEWDIQYLELDFGLQFNIFNIKKAAFYITGAISPAWMLYGTQTINNTVYNIKDIDSISNSLINFKTGIGVSHPVSHKISFIVEYIYGKSSNLEKDYEKLKINSNTVNFGFLFNIGQVLNTNQNID
jgi:hypothetical protein